MKPRQLCSSLLHKFPARPRFRQCLHVFEVARRKPFHVGKGSPQIPRQPVDDLSPPTLSLLPLEDVPPIWPTSSRFTDNLARTIGVGLRRANSLRRRPRRADLRCHNVTVSGTRLARR